MNKEFVSKAKNYIKKEVLSLRSLASTLIFLGIAYLGIDAAKFTQIHIQLEGEKNQTWYSTSDYSKRFVRLAKEKNLGQNTSNGVIFTTLGTSLFGINAFRNKKNVPKRKRK